MSLASALKWSFLGELAAKAVQPLVFIVLARLLAPEDFGVMSAALMVVSFAQIFWDAGMGKALIQRQTDVDEAANAAFWINVGLASAISILLYATSGVIAKNVFHDERVTDVLCTMSLYVLIGGLCAVHTALLQKQMGFKKLFWIRFITMGLPGLASIPLAANGLGYWALVIGTLVGQVAQAALYWQLSPWRPKWSVNMAVAKSMTNFGGWVAASGVLGWFFTWADSLFVGIYLGSHDLGLYRTGNQFSAMIFAMLFAPALPVIYSHLAAASTNAGDVRRAFKATFCIVALVAIPTATILFTYSHQLGEIIFGAKWGGIDSVIAILALMHGYSWTVGFNGEIYRALGKPAYETIVTASMLGVYLLAFVLSAPLGLEVFLWTRLSLALGALTLHLLVARHLLSFALPPIVGYLLRVSLVSGIAAYAVNFGLSNLFVSPWATLLCGSAATALLIGSSLLIMERDGLLREIPFLTKRYTK